MFKRETIKFLIPKDMSSLLSSSVGNRTVVPLYINPSQIQTNYSKNMSETQTLGGFVIQYWGDRITTLGITGTTGSGGIEAINILFDVYKHEQNTFKSVLLGRQKQLQKEQEKALKAITEKEDSVLSAAGAIDQVLFDGFFTDVTKGVSETMDLFKDVINSVETGSDLIPGKVRSEVPTLSSLAVSLEMHFQGRIHRGYIESMSITESANSPGHFDYTIQFKSLKEYGERKNFMPWHLNPRDESGTPVKKPKVGPNGLNYNLSFPFVDARGTPNTARSVSRVTDDQAGTSEETNNSDTLSRRKKVVG